MATNPTNILFIAIDDLRPQLRCYGRRQMHTPNLDRLAADGVQFNRAYCQVPVCGASRASMLTGTRPTPTRFLGYDAFADKDHPAATGLPQWLKQRGYITVSRGKVYHHRRDSPQGWSEPAWGPPDSFPGYRTPENIARLQAWVDRGRRGERGPAVEKADVSDHVYPDGQTADKLIQDLAHLKERGRPFFLGAGFVRPHLPFCAPTKYWDLYDPSAISLPESPPPTGDVPSQALHNSGELRNNYAGIPAEGAFPEETVRTLMHGYYASVSFLDAQVGRVIDALTAQGLRESTVIVFAVDHGWNLGEHGLWCKHCLFETSLRVPMLLSAPGLSGPPSDALVENLDLYPTVCELLDVEPPDHLEGKSLVPLLKDSSGPGRQAAFSRYFRGESVRSDRYRYSEWRRDGEIVARMLYDHTADPDENVNLAGRPENASVVAELSGMLPVWNDSGS